MKVFFAFKSINHIAEQFNSTSETDNAQNTKRRAVRWGGEDTKTRLKAYNTKLEIAQKDLTTRNTQQKEYGS